MYFSDASLSQNNNEILCNIPELEEGNPSNENNLSLFIVINKLIVSKKINLFRYLNTIIIDIFPKTSKFYKFAK